MLNFLDASHYKLSKALNNLNGQGEESNYKFAHYLEQAQDKSVSCSETVCCLD